MNVRIKILNLVAGVLAVCPLAAQTTYQGTRTAKCLP